MKPIMGKTEIHSSTTITNVVRSALPKAPSVKGRHREGSNKMLSCRPDETAICRQLGLISDDELGVKAESKVRNQPPGYLGKLAAVHVNNTL